MKSMITFPRQARLKRRSGFALTLVLSLVVSLGVMGLALSLMTRDAVGAAQNRFNLTRAYWRANGCLAAARADIADSIEIPRRAAMAWHALDDVVSAVGTDSSCDFLTHPTGLQLDINRADGAQVRALLIALGSRLELADSIADAILDWRDVDDVARPHGAEREWYEAAGKPIPRNGPFESTDEIRLVRGANEVPGLDTLFGVDSFRIYLDRAPGPVIAALPGMSAEAVNLILDLRARGLRVPELLEFSSRLSTVSRDQLLAHYQELLQMTTTEPEAWVVASRARSGDPAVRATVEEYLVRTGNRVITLRLRTLP